MFAFRWDVYVTRPLSAKRINKGSSRNFAFNIKRIEANHLISIPPEIYRRLKIF